MENIQVEDLFGTSVFNDDVLTVKRIISVMGVSPDIWISTDPQTAADRGIGWRTPLMLAAELNKKKVFDLLMESGSNVNLTQKNGSTALHFACEGKHTYITHKLLQSKQCNVNLRKLTDMQTPLHIAAKLGTLSVIKQLITNNADVNCKDICEETPLMHAARNGSKKIVQILINHGAHVNVVGPFREQNALYFAAKKNHIHIVCTLLKHNIEEQLINDVFLEFCTDSVELMKLVLPHIKDVNVAGRWGDTAIHLACRKGNVKVVKLLLESNCSLNITNNDGYTPLYRACIHFQHRVVKLLLQNGCDPEDKCGSISLLSTILKSKDYTKNKNIILAKIKTLALLINAGYNVSNNMGVRNSVQRLFNCSAPIVEMYQEFFNTLQYLTSQPLPLKKQCMNTVRNSISSGLMSKTLKLEIPKVLKNCLVYKDLEMLMI